MLEANRLLARRTVWSICLYFHCKSNVTVSTSMYMGVSHVQQKDKPRVIRVKGRTELNIQFIQQKRNIMDDKFFAKRKVWQMH